MKQGMALKLRTSIEIETSEVECQTDDLEEEEKGARLVEVKKRDEEIEMLKKIIEGDPDKLDTYNLCRNLIKAELRAKNAELKVLRKVINRDSSKINTLREFDNLMHQVRRKGKVMAKYDKKFLKANSKETQTQGEAASGEEVHYLRRQMHIYETQAAEKHEKVIKLYKEIDTLKEQIQNLKQ